MSAVRTRLAGGALALALGGCGGARVATAPAASPVRAEAPRVASGPVWRAVVLPPRGDDLGVAGELPVVYRGAIHRALTTPGGPTDLIAGGMRVQVQGDTVRWAPDVTVHEIRAYAHDGTRWYFASADGALFRAEGFTGVLTRIGETRGEEVLQDFTSTGVLATRTRAARYWIGGPGDEFFAPEMPTPGTMFDIGFVRRDLGLAATGPGRLLRSTDGGHHFENVDLGGEAVYVVWPMADGTAVAGTTGGLLQLGPHGNPTPYAWNEPVPWAPLPHETIQAVQNSFLTEFPAARALAALSGAVFGDGNIAQIDGADMLVVDTRGEVTRVPLPGADGASEPPACHLFGYGTSVVAQCTVSAHEHALYLWQRERGWNELRRTSGRAPVVGDHNGGGLAMLGTCESVDTVDETAVCAYDNQRWRTLHLATRARSIAGLSGGVLLYIAADAPDEPGHVPWARVLRIDGTSTDHPLALAEPDAVPTGCQLVHSGRVACFTERDERAFVAVGVPDQPLTLLPVPDGAEYLAFADEFHGIATRGTHGPMWTTVDGGHRWTRLQLPLDGAIESALDAEEGDRFDIGCHESGCVAGNVYWSPTVNSVWTARAAQDPARVQPLAERDALTASDPPEDYTAGIWSCALEGSNASSASNASNANSANAAGDAGTRLFGSGGWIEPHASAGAGATSGRFAFEWGGHDEHGAFTARARPFDLPPVAPPSYAAPGETRLIPRLLSRTLALVERCWMVPETRGSHAGALHAECGELIVAPHNGAPHRLEPHAVLLGHANEWVDRTAGLLAALALPDGGAAVHLTTMWRNAYSRDVVLRFDAHGALVGRRGYAWPQRTPRMLAQAPEGVGLVVADDSVGRWLQFYGLDPHDEGRTLAALPRGTLAPCDGTPGPRITRMVADAPGYGPNLALGDLRLPSPGYVASVLEVDPAGTVCLRSMSFESRRMQEDQEAILRGLVHGGVVARAENGALHAWSVDRDRESPMRCTAVRE